MSRIYFGRKFYLGRLSRYSGVGLIWTA